MHRTARADIPRSIVLTPSIEGTRVYWFAAAIGRHVRVPKVREATALGGAAAAAVGIGQFASLQEAGDAFVQWDLTLDPNAASRGLYYDVRHRWEAAYSAQRKLVDARITSSMWRAPGTRRQPTKLIV